MRNWIVSLLAFGSLLSVATPAFAETPPPSPPVDPDHYHVLAACYFGAEGVNGEQKGYSNERTITTGVKLDLVGWDKGGMMATGKAVLNPFHAGTTSGDYTPGGYGSLSGMAGYMTAPNAQGISYFILGGGEGDSGWSNRVEKSTNEIYDADQFRFSHLAATAEFGMNINAGEQSDALISLKARFQASTSKSTHYSDSDWQTERDGYHGYKNDLGFAMGPKFLLLVGNRDQIRVMASALYTLLGNDDGGKQLELRLEAQTDVFKLGRYGTIYAGAYVGAQWIRELTPEASDLHHGLDSLNLFEGGLETGWKF